MRTFILACALASAALIGAAIAETGQQVQNQSRYSTSATPVGVLLDDPAARAVLERIIPAVMAEPQLALGRGLTLRAMQQYAPERLADPILDQIDQALAAAAPS